MFKVERFIDVETSSPGNNRPNVVQVPNMGTGGSWDCTDYRTSYSQPAQTFSTVRLQHYSSTQSP